MDYFILIYIRWIIYRLKKDSQKLSVNTLLEKTIFIKKVIFSKKGVFRRSNGL